jgi:ABC-type multidrug transport system fused ATPase/permease subunit
VRFFAGERTGTLLSRILHDVQDATAVIYMGVVVMILDAAQLLIAMVLLASISWKLMLACVFIFPAYGLIFRALNPRVREASERAGQQLAEMAGQISERVAGQAVVKTYTAEEREIMRFEQELGKHHSSVVSESHDTVRNADRIIVLSDGHVAELGSHTELLSKPGLYARYVRIQATAFSPLSHDSAD